MTDNATAPVVALIEWARGQQALPDGTAGGAGWGHIDEKHRFKLRDLIKQIDEKREFASTPPGSAEEVARAMFEADPDIGMTWAAFVALADREPDYQPLIDGQRRAARAAVAVLAPAPAGDEVVAFVRRIADMVGDELDAHASDELRDAARTVLGSMPTGRKAEEAAWLPIESVPRDGSWFFTKTDDEFYPYDVARYDTEHEGFGKIRCGFDYVKFWRPAEEAAPGNVDQIAARMAKADGLDWDEVCGFDTDAGECDSSTCIAAHCEDHDVDWSRGQYRRYARAALGIAEPTFARCPDAPTTQRFNPGDLVSHNAGMIDAASKRQIGSVVGYDRDGGMQYRLTLPDGTDQGMAYDCELDPWPSDDAFLPMTSPRAAAYFKGGA